ncbi:spore germination protein [Brevibacillus sp. NRS-1366]|uniref:spore germination protein n=1 Tax=Brevibacillus sp. NRS-1366 TaxID=3233899 RepID=UPI003D1A3826
MRRPHCWTGGFCCRLPSSRSFFESRSKVPFPPVLEVLFMELVIEILREAGIRNC